MRYSRPPITEAILEFRYTTPCDQPKIEDAADRIKSEFFYDEIEQNVNVSSAPANMAIAIDWQGRKLSSLDRTDVVIYRRGGFVCARLAPYDGWDLFDQRARAAWSNLVKSAGRQDISRVGVRYVNRIDIPMTPEGIMDTETYLAISPKTPSSFRALNGFTLSVVHALGKDGCSATVNTASIQSPLVGHVALALDIDVFAENIEIPRREDKLWELLARMRGYKNDIFESCITDASRELFNS